ncbi:MAG TPA: hypothetical protein VF889_04345, partial [Bacteroidota bacterium]
QGQGVLQEHEGGQSDEKREDFREKSVEEGTKAGDKAVVSALRTRPDPLRRIGLFLSSRQQPLPEEVAR